MKPMVPRRCKRFLGDGIVCELTLGDRLIDASQILINNSTGAQIEMAYFRVAHLSFRQTDIGPAGAQSTGWIIAIKFVVERSAGEKRGVPILLALFFPARIDAPTVANDEQDRARHNGALCRRFSRSTSRSFVDKARKAPLHRPREVAQPIAGTYLPLRLCRPRRRLFQTLGRPKAFRNNFVHWRGTRTRPGGNDAHLRRRRRSASGLRVDESRRSDKESLEGFCRSRPGRCGNCNGNGKQSEQSSDLRR